MLAAGVVTTYPLLILKSTSARGYILIALLVVIALILGEYLAVRKNHTGWLLWSLCIALGFYTNPSMIYTFAVIFLWMALRMIRAGQVSAYASRRECAIYLVSFSILAAVFTLSFYLPVFFKNGILNFFNGSRVADSLPLGTFLAGLPDVLSEIGDEWRFHLPDGMSLLLVVGILFAVLFSRRDRRGGAILLIAFPVALGVVLLAQRPISIARMWLWVVPLLIIWAAGGLTQLLAWLTQKSKLPSYAAPVILSAVMLIFLANAVFASSRQALQLTDGVDVEKEVTLYLKTMVTQDDIVIVSDYSDAQYFYYFNTYQIPEIAYRQIKNRPFNRAFVVVYPTYKSETLPKVLTQFGPDYGFPDKSAGKMLTSIGIAHVYEIVPNPAIMQKPFGQSTNPSQK